MHQPDNRDKVLIECTNKQTQFSWLVVQRHVDTERSICANCGGEGNRLIPLRMANEIKHILPYVTR